MTVPYAPKPPPLPTRPPRDHDRTYTILLAVVAGLFVVALLGLAMVFQLPNATAESRAALRLPFIIELIYLALIMTVLAIRLIVPQFRRWPTFALNIVLLLYFPLTTALGIYGLWKVDNHRA